MFASGPVGAFSHSRGGQPVVRLLDRLADGRGRLLAIVLLLGDLGAVYLLVAAPLVDLYTGRQTILEQRRMMALHLGQSPASCLRCAPVSPGCAQRRASAGLICLKATATRSPRRTCKNESKSWRPQ